MTVSIYEHHPRSLLLSGNPIGLGTEEAESITSYLQRIAGLNGLTFGELMWGKTMGEYESSNADMATLRGVGSASLAQGSVGLSIAGLNFAEALGRLSGRSSVRWMNWRASTDGLSHARLMRKHQAWCPHCLEEDEEPYFRALWDLELVTACPRHRHQLVHLCSKCGANQRRYRCRSSSLLCQRCDQPLVSNPISRAQVRETAIAQELGGVVAGITGQRLHLSGTRMKAALFSWAEGQGAKSVKATARLLGMPQSLVCYWRYTDRVPSLQRLLELSLINGLPLLDVCRGDCGIVRRKTRHSELRRAWSFRLLGKEKKESLRDRLAEYASDPFSPCLQHVAKKLGVARGTLEAIDPSLCERVSKRADDNRSITTAVRFIHFRTQVDRYVKDRVQNGKIPTVKDVGASLRHPGMLRSPKCREYVRAMIAKARRQLSTDINSK